MRGKVGDGQKAPSSRAKERPSAPMVMVERVSTEAIVKRMFVESTGWNGET